MASIGKMSLRLAELQESNKTIEKFKAIAELKKSWKDVNRLLHHQKLLFVSEIIWTKLISRHYNNFLASYFDINKTKELINWKYY